MIDLEKIDKAIAKKFNTPLLKYSTDRRYSAIVVEKIRAESPTVIADFDKQINTVMERIKEVAGGCAPSDFLVFITSLDICEAALGAIRQRNEKAIP